MLLLLLSAATQPSVGQGYHLSRCPNFRGRLSICQRIKENRVRIPNEVELSFATLKKEFNRLRIPLAKMEPASAHKNTDSHIAYPALNTQKGIAWQVAQDVFITRRDLADHLLATLEFARSNNPNLTNLGDNSASQETPPK